MAKGIEKIVWCENIIKHWNDKNTESYSLLCTFICA